MSKEDDININLQKPHRSIKNAEELSILQKVGAEMGISVKVLASEGEKYTIKQIIYTGTVGEGKIYVEVERTKEYERKHRKSLGPFWDRVEETSKADAQ